MQNIKYDSSSAKSASVSDFYDASQDASHRYLAYRDLPSIFKQHVRGNHAIDLGAGTGLSSRFLAQQGFNVTGADVDQQMLHIAKKQMPAMDIHLIKNGEVPLSDCTFDLVFSSFVLFELDSVEAIHQYFSEVNRLLNNTGAFVAVTGSNLMHRHDIDWFTFNTSYPENRMLNPGKKVKAYHYESGIEFTDYFWPEELYLETMLKAGLKCIEIARPMGFSFEKTPWRHELYESPFNIFVAVKNA